MASFGERIRARRTELGLRQVDVAHAAGIRQLAYGDLERGKALNPRTSTLEALARALNVSADWLLSGSATSPMVTSVSVATCTCGAKSLDGAQRVCSYAELRRFADENELGLFSGITPDSRFEYLTLVDPRPGKERAVAVSVEMSSRHATAVYDGLATEIFRKWVQS
jgi:DNA-binding XRE family transcriptional regulator